MSDTPPTTPTAPTTPTTPPATPAAPVQNASASAVAEPAARPAPRPVNPQSLPPYRVLLHNDQVNSMDDVVLALRQLTAHGSTRAHEIMMTAHVRGVALVLVTHKERAELYVEQFRTKRLVVTIEPA